MRRRYSDRSARGKGYKVFPSNTAIGNPAEDRRFDGGYTVHAYGSRSPGGLDAVQLEVGRNLRTDSGFIAALGEGIAVFYRAYLEGRSPPRSMASDSAILNLMPPRNAPP